MSTPTVNLTIDRLSYGPAGVGRSDGKVVFVPGTVPGDEVIVRLDEEKKTYATGQLVALQRPSSQRRHPPCPYATRCGGCSWQHVAYAEQLRAKEAAVCEHLRRIGGISDPPLLPIIPSPQEWHYRHRIRLRVEDNLRLGFSRARSHELVEITSCSIAAESIVHNLHLAQVWLASLHTPVHQVELLTNEPAGGLVLVGDTKQAFRPQDSAVCADFLKTHPDIVGLALCGRGWRKTWGDTTISFALGVEGMTLTVSQGIFTQVNLAGNQLLIAALLRLGDTAYGVPVQKEIARTARRRLTFATIYATLSRLETKGLVTSRLGEAGPDRGGRRKKFFTLSGAGALALKRSLRTVDRMTHGIDPSWQAP